jgi:hypothetical protein
MGRTHAGWPGCGALCIASSTEPVGRQSSKQQLPSKNEPEIDPGRYRAGVENISFSQSSLEGGGFTKSMTTPRDAVQHAEWSSRPRRPPRGLYATTSHEYHESWCGVRIRLILPNAFDLHAPNACPACVQAFWRGYPRALVPGASKVGNLRRGGLSQH